MALSKGTYTPPATGQHFQGVTLTPAHLTDGTLVQTFHLAAFPQLGIRYTGTDGDGKTVPRAARTNKQ